MTLTLTPPPIIVIGEPAVFGVAATGITGFVALIDEAGSIVGGCNLIGNSGLIETAILTLGTHLLTAVGVGATSASVTVNVIQRSFTDSFSPSIIQSSLGNQWVPVPNQDVTSPGFSVAIGGPATATTANENNIAIVSEWLTDDGTITVTIPLTALLVGAGLGDGLFARLREDSGVTVGYLFTVLYDAVNLAPDLLLLRLGVFNDTGTSSMTPVVLVLPAGNLPVTLTLSVWGSQLTAFLNGAIVLSTMFERLTGPGQWGIYDSGGGGQFRDFIVMDGPSFTDLFQEAAWQVPPWFQDANGGWKIIGLSRAAPVLTSAGQYSIASLVGWNTVGSDSVALIKSYGSGQTGLLAQWNSQYQTGYALVLSATQLQLLYFAAGTPTVLATAAVTPLPSGGVPNTLEFRCSGTCFQGFLNGVCILNFVDPNGTGDSGSIGLISNDSASVVTAFSGSG